MNTVQFKTTLRNVKEVRKFAGDFPTKGLCAEKCIFLANLYSGLTDVLEKNYSLRDTDYVDIEFIMSLDDIKMLHKFNEEYPFDEFDDFIEDMT